VVIREVGPREGFQIHAQVVETARKVELITALVAARLSSIEVASFVRADRVPQMADAEAVVAALPAWSDGEYAGLYLNRSGLRRAVATQRLTVRGWLYTSPSDTFLQRNSNTSCDGSVAAIGEWVGAFRECGVELHGVMVSTAFGCALEGAIAPAQVVALVERMLRSCEQHGVSVREVCLADTVGRANPDAVRETVRLVAALGVEPSLHLHDTYGVGVANAYAGFLEGVTIFESSVGGLGGCPFTPGAAGNVATEELVYLFESLGVPTGVDLEQLCIAAALAQRIVGHELPSKVLRTRLCEPRFGCAGDQ
jgi:hydroxymethylglutaryl-CoA lyase